MTDFHFPLHDFDLILELADAHHDFNDTHHHDGTGMSLI